MNYTQARLESKARKRIQRYNLWWNETQDPLSIEFDVIRAGGQWVKKDGTKAGNGLAFHYQRAVAIIWPEIKQHRWFVKFVETWLNHKYMGVLGPASSGKTFCAAIVHLIDYYSFSSNTTVLICSTTKESLENRIWGEIKKWHRLARSRYRWLPGNLIEGRTRLVTDARDESEEGRDFRNGIIGVPLKKGNVYVGMCFVAGTPIDTPNGQVPIERIWTGELVNSALGPMRVKRTSTRMASDIVTLHLSDGKRITCTSEHPFLTDTGWVNAVDITPTHHLISTHEAMQILQSDVCPEGQQERILWEILRREVKDVGPEYDCANHIIKGFSCDRKEDKRVSHGKLGMEVKTSRESQIEGRRRGFTKSPSKLEKKARPEGVRPSRQWLSPIKGGIGSVGFVSGSPVRADNIIPQGSKVLLSKNRPSALLQTRPGMAGHKAERRSGRRNPFSTETNRERPQENESFTRLRVDHIEVHKPGSDGGNDARSTGNIVYNLEVEGHPSFSVHGCLVHNSEFLGIKNERMRLCGDELQCCPKSFLDVTVNLSGNRNFKCTGMGNPADTLDALGLLTEPHATLGGWESGIDQTPKTKTWRTRFEDGICLQLPGSDCPNMDVSENEEVPYPFLITRSKMKADAETWGKDDWHYKMFDEGMMPRGQGSRRVITRQLCIKHGAMEEPVWRDHVRTKVAFLDAAYRAVGGDRCVFGVLEYGEERDSETISGEELVSGIINQRPPGLPRKMILSLASMSVIPIEAFSVESPEDQIVAYVKTQCEARGIPPKNFFFDSGMRTSLVTSFSRLWSNMINPIDCGGKPTERQVSDNINVPCCDYYSKFITELWYSVRLVIECGQFRRMTEDVMQEGCAREWKTVGANKIEVETKADMKEKTGRSPDLFDALAIGVEGARRLGFIIRKLMNKEYEDNDDRWKFELRRKAMDRYKAHQLNYEA